VDKRALYARVGKRIRTAREREGLSQEALGAEIGLTRTSVTNIEAGNQQMPLHVFFDIAEVLKEPVDRLLAPEDDRGAQPMPTRVPPKTAKYLTGLAARTG
jgi:transcriptional regulator with XRE-family HTH domain